MKQEAEEAIDDVEARWAAVAEDVSEISLTPYKKDINSELFGIAWFPYHVVDTGQSVFHMAGFAADRQ